MSNRIPQSFIDELLARADIVDVIDSRIPLKKAGHEYKACCPFHGEKTPSFTVSPGKQFYHCFGCGAHGTALSFLMEYEHLGFVDAIEELAHQLGMEVPKTESSKDIRPSEDLYALHKVADDFFQQQLRTHDAREVAIEYLKQRGLSGEIAKIFGIGYAPPGWNNLYDHLRNKGFTDKALIESGLVIRNDQGKLYDRFRERIMFPIRDRRGRTIAFGGRVLGNDTPKYLNSPETPIFHKGRELYGLYEARQQLRKIDSLIVVEGYMDVVSLAQFEIHNAVATLGTAATSEHLQKMFRVTQEIIFCFDGDRAGKQAAWRALETALGFVKDGQTLRFLFLPDGEDPDTFVRAQGKERFIQCSKDAPTLSGYFFQHLQESVSIDTLDGRARLVELARPLIKKMQESTFKELMIDELAKRAQTNRDRLFLPQAEETEAPAHTRRPESAGEQRPSLVRTAISLLLHEPVVAKTVEPAEIGQLATMDTPGIELLIELLNFIQQRETTTTATILEHWRNREEFRHLSKLAISPPLVPSTESEFHGCIERLEKRADEHHIEKLEQKMHTGQQLSPDEKQLYKTLLERKNRPKYANKNH